MGALREALTPAGFADSRTYIQSGNVLLVAPKKSEAAVAEAVEAVLEAEFGVSTVVVAVGAARMRKTLANAPIGFGSEPGTYHYDVAFLRPSASVPDASTST